VKLPDERIKMKILRLAKQLAQSEDQLLRNVYIKKDLTFKERQEDRRLREELKARRMEATENDTSAKWIIRRGKVIDTTRAPSQLPRQQKTQEGATGTSQGSQ